MPRSNRLLLLVAPMACSPATATAPESGAHHVAGHHHDHEHGGMPHRFEKADEWAKVFDDPQRDDWQKPAEVVRALKLEPGMTVADVGAGTGYFLPHLSRAVGPSGKVLGLDIEPDMVRYMKERATREALANVEAVTIAADDPKLPAGAVDRVLIVDTWHHIGEREAYVARLAAGLRQGGFVAIVDFTMEAEKGPPRNHRIPPDAVIRELAAGGLLGQVVEETLPDQYIVVGKLR